MRKFLSVVCILLFSVVAMADQYTDMTTEVGPVAPQATDAIWDILLQFNAETGATNLVLGAAQAGGYFWTTGAGPSSAVTTDNKYYRKTLAGVPIDSFPQPANSGWGWRDLAYDGTYLYAGCEAAQILAFNPTNGALVPTMNINKPTGAAIVRALGYDSDNDRFWTGNFSSAIICFDRSGAVIWTGSLGLTGVYGMAYDNLSPGGPFLWVYDQSGSPATTMKKVGGIGSTPPVPAVVGTFQLPNPPGLTGSTAGGCEGTTAWGTYPFSMVCLDQGTPNDQVLVYEILGGAPPDLQVTLTPINPPIVVPAGGGSFSFNAAVVNNGPSQTNFTVWARIKYPDGTYTGPTLGPVAINPPVGTTVQRLRNQNIPSTYPPGAYTYLGYANLSFAYPAIDSSSFPFTKSAVAGNGPMVWDATCSGEAFPGEVVATPSTHSVLNNYPNPFNPSTSIRFTLGTSGDVQLAVYDVNGRQVANLVNGYRAAGSHEVSFDGSNLASGVYVYTLSANGLTSTAKMVLMK